MSTEQQQKGKNSNWIWPFELIEQIGEGGMGLVYRARYVVNGREVALKMLPADVTDETALARFERELEVLKNLKHPNIVRCFGGVCENHRRFYAMELVEGGTLEDKLQEKKVLPWEQVIYFALQICDALACSHAQGVVHRDIKPANFLLNRSGQLKLSDFGLASVADSRRITAAGKTAGTFLYMAPEQIRGQEVTDKTDLYALGCVLYELITGAPPFVGETPAATLHMHCQNQPNRPTEKILDCPIALERIILQLLEKDASHRPQSAQAVAAALREVKQSVAISRVTAAEVPERSRIKALTDRPKPADSSFEQRPALKRLSEHSADAPKWIPIALGILLACSLSWNVIQIVQQHSVDHGEHLWVQATTSHDPQVRAIAAQSIGTIAQRTGRHLPLLEEMLLDDDFRVRMESIRGISNAGRYGRHLVPTLIRVQKNDDESQVRTAASQAVEHLKGDFPDDDSSASLGWLTAILLSVVTTVGIYYWFQTSQSKSSPTLARPGT